MDVAFQQLTQDTAKLAYKTEGLRDFGNACGAHSAI
jgi:hypothetical protein